MKISHLAQGITLALLVTTNLSCSAVAWQEFNDPQGEFSINMPSPVTPTEREPGLPAYDAKEGEVEYRVSVNKRSSLDEKAEIEVFCNTFAESFEKNMKDQKFPVTRAVAEEVSGPNWKGKLYQFDKTDGSSTTIEICVEPKHNIILYAFGASRNDPQASKFFSSFKVK